MYTIDFFLKQKLCTSFLYYENHGEAPSREFFEKSAEGQKKYKHMSYKNIVSFQEVSYVLSFLTEL